jgi:L-ascorbate metabolism protein UlaG (beta-lactamase superfamily)
VLIDPFLSRSKRARPVLDVTVRDVEADALFVTHGHFDHAYDVPAIARQTGAPVYASTSVCESLHDLGVSARQLHPMAGGRTCRVGQVAVRAVAARHVRFDPLLVWRALRRIGRSAFSLLQTVGAYPCGDVLGYQLRASEGTVAHFGSAGWYLDQLALLEPDVALLPLQGSSRISKIVLQAAERLRPRRVIAHHHDDFFPPLSEQVDLRPFVELLALRLPDVEAVAPAIGEWMSLF